MPVADTEAIEDAAKSKASRAVEYIRTVHVDPPRFSLLTMLILLVVAVCLVLGYGWYKARERDKWWRAEIASKSVKVTNAIKKANAELPDDEILKTLGDSDAALRTAEERLRQKPAPATDTCPVIPLGCLRVR
jgi:hypothetical protein